MNDGALRIDEGLAEVGWERVGLKTRLFRQVKRVREHRLALTGVAITFLLTVVAIFGPLFAPYDPIKQNLSATLQPPSWSHWLGTDDLGRDVLSRVIYSARVALEVAVISTGIGAVVGTVLGVSAGYFGGWVDTVLGRIFDALLAFPTLVLALGIMAALGASLTNVMIAVGIVFVPVFGRLVRGSALSLRERDFVEAARAAGANDLRIIVGHILPNLMPIVIVQATLSMAFAILAEAGLSFLGLGLRPPAPSWGTMLQSAYGYMNMAPWLPLSPGLAIVLAVVGFNAIGDGIRDLLDPRLKHLLARQETRLGR